MLHIAKFDGEKWKHTLFIESEDSIWLRFFSAEIYLWNLHNLNQNPCRIFFFFLEIQKLVLKFIWNAKDLNRQL